MSILVPVYEEQEALRYANYTPTEWHDLPYQDKAFCIAHYRFSKLIALHGNDAVSDKMEQEAKKSKGSRMRHR